MKKCLLFFDEFESDLSNALLKREDFDFVLLRTDKSIRFLNENYLEKTRNCKTFVIETVKSIDENVENFKKWCENNSISITHFYNDSEYYQELIQCFARKLGVTNALSDEQVKIVRDKANMKEKLKKLGILTMPYACINTKDDLILFLKANEVFPKIIKPRKGLSSINVFRIDSLDQISSLGINIFDGNYIIEDYCKFDMWILDGIIKNNELLYDFIAYKPYSSLEFASSNSDKFAHITTIDCPSDFCFNYKELLNKILKLAGLQNGYLHLEMFLNDSGQPIVCEFGWRFAGNYIPQNHSIAFDFDIYNTFLDIILENKREYEKLNGKCCVADMYFPKKTGIIENIPSLDELLKFPNVINGNIFQKIGDISIKKRKYNDFSGWLQLTGNSIEELILSMEVIYNYFIPSYVVNDVKKKQLRR